MKIKRRATVTSEYAGSRYNEPSFTGFEQWPADWQKAALERNL